MKLDHIIFQSLSSCEAQLLHKAVIGSVMTAYKSGIRDATLLQLCSLHPKDIAENAAYSMSQAGLSVSEDTAVLLVVQALAEIVRKEGNI